MNKSDVLNKEEKARAISCVNNIQDKLSAIKIELISENVHKSYISEKIESICWDSNCIKSMCEVRKNGN